MLVFFFKKKRKGLLFFELFFLKREGVERGCFVNIVVMWIVLIREKVTAGVSGRIDKGTEKRLEMMWCQHGCHSCKEQEVYNAVRTTQLHTVQQRPLTLPSHQRTLRPLGVTGGLSLQKLCLFDETGD